MKLRWLSIFKLPSHFDSSLLFQTVHHKPVPDTHPPLSPQPQQGGEASLLTLHDIFLESPFLSKHTPLHTPNTGALVLFLCSRPLQKELGLWLSPPDLTEGLAKCTFRRLYGALMLTSQGNCGPNLILVCGGRYWWQQHTFSRSGIRGTKKTKLSLPCFPLILFLCICTG